MKTRNATPFLRRALGAATLIVALAAPAAAGDAYGRVHQIHTLDSRVAESLVWDICKSSDSSGERCAVQQATPSSITVFGTDEVHAAVVRMLLEKDVRLPDALRFQVTLVEAAISNGGKPDKLPANVERALAAVSELLPFKVFRILDTGLVTTTRVARTNFEDPEGNPYYVELRYRSALTRGSALELSVDIEVNGRKSGAMPEGEPLLSSVVTLDAGETVVAGTSRGAAGKALMVLLTALPLDG